MAGILQHLRSSTLDKRPNPASMVDGQVAINYASGAPGMFFKNNNGDLVKVGPVHVGSTAPNASPASGGTAGNSVGEQWLDNSGGTYVFKIWDGSAWRSEAGEFVNATGDTMTGDLVMNDADIVFEGSTEDGFETTLTVVNPTADRTITLPNVTGTVVTTGDSGTVTSTMIADGTIVNADINASAAIAGTKIDPDFGSQTVETTGVFSAAGGAAATPSIAFTGDLNTGIYSPGADQVAISTNGTGRLFVDANGNVGVGAAPTTNLDVYQDLNGSPRLLVQNPNTGAFAGAQLRASGSLGSITMGAYSAANSFFGGGCGVLATTSSLTGGLQLDAAGASPLVLHTNSTERLRITSDGKVGLGTTTPSGNLEIAAPLPQILLTDTDGNATHGLTGVGNGSLVLFADSGNGGSGVSSLQLAVDGSERARIDSSGRLGLGTTVEGQDNADNLTIADSGSCGITIRSASNNFGRIYFSDGTSGDAEYRGIVQYDHTNDRLQFAANALTAMTIDSSQRVGIGTTSPTDDLTVVASANSGGATFSRLSGTVRLKLYGNSASPAEILFGDTISGAGSEQGRISYDNATDALRFFANAGERARIDSSGRLLVGTSSTLDQNASLQVNSAVAQAVEIFYSSDTPSGPYVVVAKARGTTGSPTEVASGDILGGLIARGYDGTQYRDGAYILAEADGTWTDGGDTTDNPTRLTFFTTADGASSPTEQMRISNSGEVTFSPISGTVIKIGGGSTSIYRSGGAGSGIHFTTNATIPADETGTVSDNQESLGLGAYRWSTIYAATGTINTSDAKLKQDVENLSIAELATATAIKSLIKKFRFTDAVADKGDEARIHVGVIAQEVEQAFMDAGLDPRRYALFCEDELEDGTKRLGIRYDELLAFVIAAL